MIGAIDIQYHVNKWIEQMNDKYDKFKVLDIDVVVARTFTMATVLYEREYKVL